MARITDVHNNFATGSDPSGSQQNQGDPQAVGDEKMCYLHPHRGEKKHVDRPRERAAGSVSPSVAIAPVTLIARKQSVRISAEVRRSVALLPTRLPHSS